VDRDEAGFWHRDANWWALMSGFWHSENEPSRVEEYKDYWRRAHKALVDGLTAEDAYAGQYVGYVNHDGHASMRAEMEAYYGGHADKVEQIRKRWDPDQQFSHSRWCRQKEGCTIT
jgi:hypothetical protein